MTDNQQGGEVRLEALFAAARASPPEVPDTLMARVLADAEALRPEPRPRGWRAALRAIGGLPGLGGLVTATVVGFWLGVAPPEALPDVAGQLWLAQDSAELQDMATFGWDIEEG